LKRWTRAKKALIAGDVVGRQGFFEHEQFESVKNHLPPHMQGIVLADVEASRASGIR
jgi:hypothetical protein